MTTSSQPAVLILGANGRIGLCLAQAFHEAGWRVIAQLRRSPDPRLAAAVQVTQTDIGDSVQLARDGAGASLVVHALNPYYTRWATELVPMASAAMDVAQRLGARLLLPGNIYNFGAAMPPLLLENTPQTAATRKGVLRTRLEAELERRAAEGRLAVSVVRAGDFFGASTGNWFDQAIVKSLRAGKLVYPGPLDVQHAWAYLPDLARAFVALAERPARQCAAFERFHFAGHTLTGQQLLQAIQQAATILGVPRSRDWVHGNMPWSLIRLGGLVVPMWRELAEMAYLWSVPHALDGHALERAVGPLVHTALPDAVRETLRGLGFGIPSTTTGAHTPFLAKHP